MNPKIALAWTALAFVTLFAAPAVLADGDIRVDVVVDVTDAGKRIAHPTPDKPVYYLPISVGYREMGAYVPNQDSPPPKAEVEDFLNRVLSGQGYRVMTKQSAPSLVLVFWWGHMAPEVSSTEISAPATHTNSFNEGQLAGNGVAAFDSFDPRKLIAGLPTSQTANENQMVSLVAGNTRDYQQPSPIANPILQQVLAMEKEPRHYLIISAFDFTDWLHHQATLLWQAHVSTELWGRSLSQVMEPMIVAAAPLLGRETIAPRFIGTPVARVIVGKPVVTGFPAISIPALEENHGQSLNLVNRILPDTLP